MFAQKSSEIDKINEYLNIVTRSSKQLLDIVNDILEVSNIDSGKLVFENKDFDLEEMVEAIIDSITPRASEKNLDLSLEFEKPFNRMVKSDKWRIRQVIMSLLGNAVKFTPERGNISLHDGVGDISSTKKILMLV